MKRGDVSMSWDRKKGEETKYYLIFNDMETSLSQLVRFDMRHEDLKCGWKSWGEDVMLCCAMLCYTTVYSK